MLEPLCVNCEYFDGGGLKKVLDARVYGEVLHGDCGNSKAPNFETRSIDTCQEFYPDSTTWPDTSRRRMTKRPSGQWAWLSEPLGGGNEI